MTVLGIDPGITGALALVGEDSIIALYDMPLVYKTVTRKRPQRKDKPPPVPATHKVKKRSLNAALLARWIREWSPSHVFVEESQTSMLSGKGRRESASAVASTFQFYGEIRGVLAALEIPATYIPPVTWKGALKLLGKGKGDSIKRVLELYPQVAEQLTLKKHDGRAEALLICHYGRSKELNT